MNGNERGGTASGLFTLLLLALLAIMGTLTVIMAAQAYRGAVARSDERAESRILRALPRNVVWAEDCLGAIDVAEEEGLLVLRVIYADEEDEEETYIKRVYCYDGQLMELFTDAARPFNPRNGEVICPAQSFEPELNEGMLTVRVTGTQGQSYTVNTALRTEETP